MCVIKAGYKKYNELSQAVLAERLIRLAFPRSRRGEKMVIFDLGGGPLVAKVVRYLLRVKPERTHFLAFRRAFHGRFMPELTNSNPTQKEYAPHSGITVHTLPYPQSKEDFSEALNLIPYLPKKNINALFIEGIQGEGGINNPDPQAIRNLCRVFKKEIPEISIVFDEIQTGLGRTGKWFSYEHYGIRPDIVLVGKALGGGLPISAAVVPYYPLPFAWHGGTFPGYPAAVAQAIVTLDIIEKDGLVKNAAKMGRYLSLKLSNICRRNKGIYHKGFGLMQGLEFRKKDGSGDPKRRDKVLKRLMEKNIFTTDAGIPSQNPTIRFMPALTVDRKTIDFLIEKLKESL
jgi:4-aminobutyrate aminotransferase-like enzyme